MSEQFNKMSAFLKGMQNMARGIEREDIRVIVALIDVYYTDLYSPKVEAMKDE